jgi:hypothetical protein
MPTRRPRNARRPRRPGPIRRTRRARQARGTGQARDTRPHRRARQTSRTGTARKTGQPRQARTPRRPRRPRPDRRPGRSRGSRRPGRPRRPGRGGRLGRPRPPRAARDIGLTLSRAVPNLGLRRLGPRPGLALHGPGLLQGRPRRTRRTRHDRPGRGRRQQRHIYRPGHAVVELIGAGRDRRQGRQRGQPDEHCDDQDITAGRAGEPVGAVDAVQALAQHLDRRHEPVVVRLPHSCPPPQ